MADTTVDAPAPSDFVIVRTPQGNVRFPRSTPPDEIERALGEMQKPAAPSWWEQHPNVRTAAKLGLDTLPGIGGIAGGLLTAPETGGIGTIPGMAFGAGVGRGLRDLIAEGTGLEHSSPLSKAGGIATETALAGVTPGIIEAVSSPWQTLKMAGTEFEHAVPDWMRRAGRLFKPPLAEPGPITTRPSWQQPWTPAGEPPPSSPPPRTGTSFESSTPPPQGPTPYSSPVGRIIPAEPPIPEGMRATGTGTAASSPLPTEPTPYSARVRTVPEAPPPTAEPPPSTPAGRSTGTGTGAGVPLPQGPLPWRSIAKVVPEAAKETVEGAAKAATPLTEAEVGSAFDPTNKEGVQAWRKNLQDQIRKLYDEHGAEEGSRIFFGKKGAGLTDIELTREEQRDLFRRIAKGAEGDMPNAKLRRLQAAFEKTPGDETLRKQIQDELARRAAQK